MYVGMCVSIRMSMHVVVYAYARLYVVCVCVQCVCVHAYMCGHGIHTAQMGALTCAHLSTHMHALCAHVLCI